MKHICIGTIQEKLICVRFLSDHELLDCVSTAIAAILSVVTVTRMISNTITTATGTAARNIQKYVRLVDISTSQYFYRHATACTYEVRLRGVYNNPMSSLCKLDYSDHGANRTPDIMMSIISSKVR